MDDFLSNQQLLDVLQYAKTATAIHVGETAVIQMANQAMLDIWGKDTSVIGKSLEEALPELKGQPFIEMFRNVWLHGLTIAGTDTAADLVVGGKLTTFYFDFEYRAILDARGKTICILHSAVDVTDRVLGKIAAQMLEQEQAALRREQELNEELAATNEELQASNDQLQEAQEALHLLNNQLEQLVAERTLGLTTSEARLRSVLEQSPLSFCILSGPEMTIEFANESMLALWSVDRSVIGKPHAQARPQPETAEFLQVLDQVYQTGIAFTGKEVKAFTAAGNKHEWGYFNFTYHPLKDEAGKTTGIVAIVDDVTEAVLTKLEAAQINQQLSLAMEAANLGAWYLEPATKALRYNDTLAKLFGYEGATPMTYAQALAQVVPSQREKIAAAIDKAIGDGGDYDISFQQARFSDGVVLWLRSFGRMSYDANSEAYMFLGFVMDITEQKKEEERKNSFIGMVSHELKTPLTTLQGYLQLAQVHANEKQDSFTSTALEHTIKQVRKMTTMINGFLNVSRLESGEIHIEKARFEMGVLLSEIFSEAKILYPGRELIIETCENAWVYGDRDKIGQVINNLISNATKYSDGRFPIKVECEIKNNQVHVCITDKGIGIEEKHLANIFKRYYRVSESPGVAGFGIGLYLCAEIIGRHQGRIWAESKQGEGAVFSFVIPLIK